MDFLFISEGCPTCFFAKRILDSKGGTGYVKIVEVQLDISSRKYMTIVDGKECGEAPVNRVPALYISKTEELFTGEEAVEEIINAYWKNEDKVCNEGTSSKEEV